MKKVKKTNVITRHGARSVSATPRTNLALKNEKKTETEYPMFRGQEGTTTVVGAVTYETAKRGRQQERNLTNLHPSTDINLFGSKREHSEIESKSSDTPRAFLNQGNQPKKSPSKVTVPNTEEEEVP